MAKCESAKTRRDVLMLAGQIMLTAGAAAEAAAAPRRTAGPTVETDICVYGGTAGGVIAAVQARRMGKSVVLVEPGKHLGGMTTGGLGMTDIGNNEAIGGLGREFYRRVLEHYAAAYGPEAQQVKDCAGGFRFEPGVAERLLERMIAESEAPVYRGCRLRWVRKRGNRIVALRTENGALFRARMFIDASYEGDLMAAAKVSYAVGREGNAAYGETLNGVQVGQGAHNFRLPVDPYVVEGLPSSGLLKGIDPEPVGENGHGDRRVQAYNFRLCLTDLPENQVPFPKPEGYDPDRYTLYARYLQKGVFEIFGNSQRMPNRKTDTNNHGAFATDFIGQSWDYPDGDAATRERIRQAHVTYTKGLFWFLCHDERVPGEVRSQVSRWGLAKDEFVDTGNWPHQLYIREARRMVSDVVMTELHCRGRVKADDAVGLGAYGMDSHHVRRLVKDGRVLNEGDVQVGGFPPYPVAYRSIVPRERECANLLVPVCLSASHIAYGSIRMEPVFMVLGQSAATAASLAIDGGVPVQQVDGSRLRERLLADGQVLEWKGRAPANTTVAPLIDPKSLKGVVLDDSEGRKTGKWIASSRASERRVGTGYVHDGNADKGGCAIAYRPDLPEEGEYEIILISPPNENRASNAPVTIAAPGMEAVTVKVDQRSGATNGFQSLGKFHLPKGTGTTVTLSNAGTDGYVVADGLQLIAADANG